MSDDEFVRAAYLRPFLRESLMIEGIHRDPSADETEATERFLKLERVGLDDVCRLQEVYAPGKPLRDRVGMNVRVGRYVAPMGGRDIPAALMKVCKRIGRPHSDPWREHVAFEKLHPFMDGNGRTGRALWAWHMLRVGQDPFALGFLHRFYYQTLAAMEGVRG